MPNWWHSYMDITGPSDEIARFKRTCIRFAAEQAQLDFGAIAPVPDFPAEATLEWAAAHWGTDRPALCFQVTRDEPNSYECRFDTAQSPPVPIWRKLGEMFPTLEFSLSGYDLINEEGFRGTIRNGKLELLDARLIWETIDPKTGKTVSGMRDEVDAVQGEQLAFYLS